MPHSMEGSKASEVRMDDDVLEFFPLQAQKSSNIMGEIEAKRLAAQKKLAEKRMRAEQDIDGNRQNQTQQIIHPPAGGVNVSAKRKRDSVTSSVDDQQRKRIQEKAEAAIQKRLQSLKRQETNAKMASVPLASLASIPVTPVTSCPVNVLRVSIPVKVASAAPSPVNLPQAVSAPVHVASSSAPEPVSSSSGHPSSKVNSDLIRKKRQEAIAKLARKQASAASVALDVPELNQMLPPPTAATSGAAVEAHPGRLQLEKGQSKVSSEEIKPNCDMPTHTSIGHSIIVDLCLIPSAPDWFEVSHQGYSQVLNNLLSGLSNRVWSDKTRRWRFPLSSYDEVQLKLRNPGRDSQGRHILRTEIRGLPNGMVPRLLHRMKKKPEDDHGSEDPLSRLPLEILKS